MPAPQASILKNLWKMNLKGKAIALPTTWKGWTKQSNEELWKPTDNKVPNPMHLFRNETTNKYHVDTHNSIHETFNKLIDKTSDGICQQWSTFHSSAKWVGVLVNGPIGIASPGTMMPPGLMNGMLLYSRCQAFSEKPNFQKVVRAICNAFGTAFTAWQTGYGHYTLPYPSGAVQSCTMIPVPNVPLPLISGVSPGDAMMTKPALFGQMLGMLGGKPGNHVMQLLDAAATALSMVFLTWKSTSMISTITAGGGVAPPPPSPPGPVVGAVGFGGMLT